MSTTPSSSPGIERLNEAALSRAGRREQWIVFSILMPAFALIAVFLLLPIGWLLGLSFVENDKWSLHHYERLFEFGSYARIFITTFEISLIVTLANIILGYPVAYLITQMSSRMAAFCIGLVIIPFWTSLLVRTYAWLVLLQRQGLINNAAIKSGLISEPMPLAYNYTGTLIGMIHITLPFFILPLYSSMKSFDWDLMKAASNLGASPVSAFFRVFLPLSLPGLLAGLVIVFILCLGFYVTPQILGGGNVTMVAMKIASNVSIYFDWGAASAVGAVLLLAVLLSLYVLHRAVGIQRMTGQGS